MGTRGTAFVPAADCPSPSWATVNPRSPPHLTRLQRLSRRAGSCRAGASGATHLHVVEFGAWIGRVGPQNGKFSPQAQRTQQALNALDRSQALRL